MLMQKCNYIYDMRCLLQIGHSLSSLTHSLSSSSLRALKHLHVHTHLAPPCIFNSLTSAQALTTTASQNCTLHSRRDHSLYSYYMGYYYFTDRIARRTVGERVVVAFAFILFCESTRMDTDEEKKPKVRRSAAPASRRDAIPTTKKINMIRSW